MLKDLNIDEFKFQPPEGTGASSSFIYNPVEHVITVDLYIVNNTCL